jgi:16S rRNA (guanine(966)-N(2))-methyltransferase RsmD
VRVIAGTLKGRRLRGPDDDAVRPTSDRLRETLFNVLAGTVEGARVLDGFGGTAAVAIEAISRGASRVTVYETSPNALKVARQNLEACGIGDQCTVIRGDFLRATGRADHDLVFLDPPYDITSLEDVVAAGAAHLAPGGRLVLEHRRARPSPPAAGSLQRVRVLEAGDSALSFYR